MGTTVSDYVTLPMPFVWVFLFAFLLYRWRSLGRGLLVLGGLLLILSSVPAVGRLLLVGLTAATPSHDGRTSDGIAAIVVPTAGTFEDGAGKWWAGEDSVRRATAGREIQERLGLPLIIAGGPPLAGQPPEARSVVAQLDLKENLRLETRSRNSIETGQAVAAMLKDVGRAKVILVTSTAHVARMAASLRHYGVSVVAAPVGEAVLDIGLGAWRVGDFVPSFEGFQQTSAALWEYLAIAWYLSTGFLDFEDLQPKF